MPARTSEGRQTRERNKPRRSALPTSFAKISPAAPNGYPSRWSRSNVTTQAGSGIVRRPALDFGNGFMDVLPLTSTTVRITDSREAPGPRAGVGDGVPIALDPESPTDDVRDTRAAEHHNTAYLLLGATIFGALGVPSASWVESRRRRAATAGRQHHRRGTEHVITSRRPQVTSTF
jgi:hypothetical protein